MARARAKCRRAPGGGTIAQMTARPMRARLVAALRDIREELRELRQQLELKLGKS
jgi:hypothetical protein